MEKRKGERHTITCSIRSRYHRALVDDRDVVATFLQHVDAGTDSKDAASDDDDLLVCSARTRIEQIACDFGGEVLHGDVGGVCLNFDRGLKEI